MRAPLVASLLVLALAAAHAGEKIDTGFDPATDGLPWTNVGSYASPNGDCFGMSVTALLRFEARKSGAARARGDFDLEERALAGLIQNRYLTEWHAGLAERVMPKLLSIGDPRSADPILERLKTGEPVVVHLQGETNAHAVLFFGFDGSDFLVYDPDSPNETKKWSFSAKSGFSKWNVTFGWGKYQKLTIYDPGDIAAMPTLANLEALRDDCDRMGATCAAPFATVSAGAARDAKDGVALVVSGSVSGGLAADPEGRPAEKPKQVVVFVNGQAVATLDLDRAGRFATTVPGALAAGAEASVRFAAVASKERLAGFAETTVAAAPSRTRGMASALDDH